MRKLAIIEIVNQRLADKGVIRPAELATAVGISRQAASRHLSGMVQSGLLERGGAGRATLYRLPTASPIQRTYPLSGLDEDQVWRELVDGNPPLVAHPSQVQGLVRYAFTEMLNNAIDHSQGTHAEVTFVQSHERIWFEIRDDGVGIFQRLATHLRLDSLHLALEALSKGKLTTDAVRHTEKGIFFTSKVMDRFELGSGGIAWLVDNTTQDFAVQDVRSMVGTRVRCDIDPRTSRTLQGVFAEYTEDFQFSRTRIVVKLFERGAWFVSRSEAKRLLDGLEQFRAVVLDFHGVTGVGQGFADEVLRVWPAQHSEVRVTPMNMSPSVEFMIRRATPR